MLSYIVRRLVYMIFTLFGVSTVVFFLLRLVPGDVVSQMVDLQGQSNPQRVVELRHFFGLDRPWYIQYLRWLGHIATGNLGDSWRVGGSVTSHLFAQLGVTMELTALATLLSLVVGIPMGIWAATRQNGVIDQLLRVVSLAGLSVPVFWTGSMLILICSLALRWTPSTRWISPSADLFGNAKLMLLPALTLGVANAAVIVRMTRNSVLEVLFQDYVRTARSKGLGERAVVVRHALKNALIPVVTVAGLQMGFLLGGAIVMEEVFALPGLGRLLLQGLTQRDYPMVQGAVLIFALLFMLINLITDLIYGFLDPRVHYV